MSEISFKKAKLSDYLTISVLLKTVFIQTYAIDGITIEFANFITKEFSPENIKKKIEKNQNKLIIAYKNDNPIGMAEIIYDSNCSIRKISVPELDKLYVLESFYGKGVGYKLIREAEKAVFENGFNQMNIEVYIGNARAIDFYKRQGYISIGTVDFKMEENSYENLVMNKILS